VQLGVSASEPVDHHGKLLVLEAVAYLGVPHSSAGLYTLPVKEFIN
jgi:hypothetical protein